MTDQSQTTPEQEPTMSRNEALALREDMSLGQMADIFVRSGFFSDTRKMSQALVKIVAGRELGFPPIASMTGIDIIDGRVAFSANFMAAMIKRSGRYWYTVKVMTDQECTLEFYSIGADGARVPEGMSTFTLADAQRAKTKNMDKFPRNMLFARAMSNGFRWYTPDLAGGPVYTPEELGREVDEQGELLRKPNLPSVTEMFSGEPKPAAQQVVEQKHQPLEVEAAQAQPSLPSQAEAEAQLKREVPGYKTEAEKEAAKTGKPAAPRSQSGLPPMGEPPRPDDEQPEGMPQAELDALAKQARGVGLPDDGDAEPTIYTKGVLRYRKNAQGQEEVELKAQSWKLAQQVVGPKGLSPEAMQKFNKMFGQDAGSTKHMVAHLEKWFKVKAIPSLTWEQLAACVKANAAEPLYDPRWYQAKIDELAAKQVKTETKAKVADAKALLGDQAAAVAKAYCLPANDPLLAELARLTVPNDEGGRDAAPLALAYLYAKPKKGETRKPWTKDSREHLETLLTLVLEQGLEIGSEQFEICVDSVEMGGVAE